MRSVPSSDVTISWSARRVAAPSCREGVLSVTCSCCTRASTRARGCICAKCTYARARSLARKQASDSRTHARTQVTQHARTRLHARTNTRMRARALAGQRSYGRRHAWATRTAGVATASDALTSVSSGLPTAYASCAAAAQPSDTRTSRRSNRSCRTAAAGLTPVPTSAPGLGSPVPTSAPRLGSPLPTSAPRLG